MRRPFAGFTAILFKEFTIMFRDPATLFFMFFPPIVQIIAFGFALDNDVRHMRTVVLNEDRTSESRQLIEKFANTSSFRIVGEVHSRTELEAAIRQGHAYVGLQIPPNFTRDSRAGRGATVQVLIDGSSSTVAMQALQTSMGLALRESLLTLMQETGHRAMPVEVRPQILYNPTMKSAHFYVPGVMGIALQIATVFATALALVREREKGTLENLLVAPLSRWGLMLGKLTPYLLVAMTMAMMIFLVARWVFQIPFRGDLATVVLATFLYVFAMLSLGLLISTKAENHMQAMQLTLALLLPAVFFSGFLFPRENMPALFYGLSTLIPATYFIELMRAIMLRGATLMDYWQHFAILAGMGTLLFSAAALRFRSRLA